MSATTLPVSPGSGASVAGKTETFGGSSVAFFQGVSQYDATPGSTNGQVIDAAGNAHVINAVPANFAPAQVTVAATATLISAARAARQVLIVVQTTTTPIYLGGSGVTTSTGHLLPGVVGASIAIPFTGALYGIVATSTALVTVAETY